MIKPSNDSCEDNSCAQDLKILSPALTCLAWLTILPALVHAECQILPPGAPPLSAFEVVECAGTPDEGGVQGAFVDDVTVNVLEGGSIDVENRRAVSLRNRARVHVESGGIIRMQKDGASQFAVVLGGGSTVVVNKGGRISAINLSNATSDAITGGSTFEIAGTVSSEGNFSDGIDVGTAEITVLPSGLISANGRNSDGIDSDGADTAVFVEGTVMVLGDQSTAVQLNRDASVTIGKSGYVSAQGLDSIAIGLADRSLVLNQGMVSSEQVAIRAFGPVEVTNEGSLFGDVVLNFGADIFRHNAELGEIVGEIDGGEALDEFTLTGGLFDLTRPRNFEVSIIEAGAVGFGAGELTEVAVRAGGRLAPGESIGVLTVLEDLTVEPEGALEIQIDVPQSSADLVTVFGNATLDGQISAELLAGSPFELDAQTINLLEAAGTITGTLVDGGLPVPSGIVGLDMALGLADASAAGIVINNGQVLQATFSIVDLIFAYNNELKAQP